LDLYLVGIRDVGRSADRSGMIMLYVFGIDTGLRIAGWGAMPMESMEICERMGAQIIEQTEEPDFFVCVDVAELVGVGLSS